MATYQDVNGDPQSDTSSEQPAPSTQRLSGMLANQIKSTMDYATMKAAETRTFVEKQVNGAVEVGHDIVNKADEIPVVHETAHYVSFLLRTAISCFFGTVNYFKSAASSTTMAVRNTVNDTTTKATEAVKASVTTYRQMAYDNAKQATGLIASIAQKFLPAPVYDLGNEFIHDPINTTRQQLPPKVVELGDKAADVGVKYYGIAKDMTDKTKSNIDAVKNEAVKKANEAKEMAMQTIGFSRKAKEE